MKPGIYRSVMSLKLVAAFVVLIALTTACAAFAATTPTKQNYVPGQAIIHVRPGTTSTAVQAAVERMGYKLVKGLSMANYYLIEASASKAPPVYTAPVYGVPVYKSPVRRLTILSNAATTGSWVIDQFQPNIKYYALAEPRDSEYEHEKWNMDLIHMPAAWDQFSVGQRGSSSVVVAVVDTGVFYYHEDLKDRVILPGYDAITPGGDGLDLPGGGHGTHVAGIIAAQGENSFTTPPPANEFIQYFGVCGVCWDNVKILPVRVLGPNGGSTAEVVEGLSFAQSQKVGVVNMSLGGPPHDISDPVFRSKIVEMVKAGTIVVCAAGNSGDTTYPNVGVPAAFPETIAVGSVGPEDEIAPYSSWGPGYIVDIAAPGGDSSLTPATPADSMVYSTYAEWRDEGGDQLIPYWGFASMEGTSMAAPHVAGAAALLLSQGIPPQEVRSRLLDSARAPAAGNMDKRKYGAGILDVAAALANASVKIISPAKGGTVNSTPDVEINVRGIDPETIKVLYDYGQDSSSPGIPTNPDAETPIIDSSNYARYMNAQRTTIRFNWASVGLSPLGTGIHHIYVEASSMSVGQLVRDWAKFDVSGTKIDKGLYMFAFPYVFYRSAYSSTDGTLVTPNYAPGISPASILKEADFSSLGDSRCVLRRWVPTRGDYVTYYPGGALSSLIWENPFDGGIRTGGGFFPESGLFPGDESNIAEAPAGSGYWLTLTKDVYIDESYPTLDNWPLQSDNTTPCAANGYCIPIYTGWNMIGNPYAHQIAWTSARFSYQGQEKDLQGAVDAGWIKLPFYRYNNKGVSGYQSLDYHTLLKPYEGYWVRAGVGGTGQYNKLYMIVQP